MRPYLEGYHFTVLTDHQALKWLQKIDSPTGRLARWALELQQFDFEIKYRKGSTNQVADALSRQPTPDTTDELCYTLPDTTCPWYRRIKEAVTNRPTNYPEYNIINGRLYRLVLTHLEKGPNLRLEAMYSHRPAKENPPTDARCSNRRTPRCHQDPPPSREKFLLARNVS